MALSYGVRRADRALPDLGARVILDSSRQDLRDGLGGIPYMIKPNLEEFCALTGTSSRPEIIKAAGQILSRGVALVVISQGAEGVTVVTADQIWKANVTIDENRVISDGVGSGDALVGGFAVGLLEQKSLVDTFRLGETGGAALTYSRFARCRGLDASLNFTEFGPESGGGDCAVAVGAFFMHITARCCARLMRPTRPL